MSSAATNEEPFFAESAAAGTTVTVRFEDEDSETKNKKDEPPRFAVAYWSIRGLAAPLRMMLCAARTDHTAILYNLVECKEAKWKSDYFEEKQEIMDKYRCPLLNLPYVVDRKEKRVISQSNACLAYLGRELGMWGDSKADASRCEELLCEIYDLRNIMVQFAYGTGEPKATMKSASRNLAKLELWLKLGAGAEKKRKASMDKGFNIVVEDVMEEPDVAVIHLVGGKSTAPDFHLFEMLDQFGGLCSFYELPDFLDDYPSLKAFKTGFEKLWENQFYLQSWLHTDLPYNNCSAQFGSLPGPASYKHGETEKAAWRNKGETTLTSKHSSFKGRVVYE